MMMNYYYLNWESRCKNIAMLDLKLNERLINYRQSSLYRQRRILSSAQAAKVYYQGQPIISFASNDYLGLANHPQVIKAFQEAAEKYGVGSGASQLITGHRSAHHDLENAFAEFMQRDAALLFSNGYMANLGVMTALAQTGDYIYQDKLNHASLIDAGLLAKAQAKRYSHNNLTHLDAHLSKQIQGQKLIVTDSVFSMRGDIARIPELVELARRHQAWLMVDDAHGIGILGKNG